MPGTSDPAVDEITAVDTVIFSDVHLGSPMSRAYDLLCSLREYRFKRLVITGDMV